MKIAYSGTHSTGKTTAVYQSAKDYKLLWPEVRIELITEVARRNPFQLLNRKATENSQLWMFSTQIREEIYLSSCCDMIICDRSIVDYIAYTQYLFPDLANSMFEIAKYYIESYDKIFFTSLDKNTQLWQDGIRDEDEEYRKDIEDNMLQLYFDLRKQGKEFEMEII